MKFTHVLLGALALALVSHQSVSAQEYPTRPVKLVVGFAAGGPTDVLARVMAEWLTTRLGQGVFVENQTGAGSNVATQAVVNAPPDGHTVLVISTSNAINTSFYKSLPYNFDRDIVPVAGLGRISYIMAVHPSVPAKTVPEFIAYAKANPGTINFASGGVGGSNHLTGELFGALTGIKIVHVPYRGNAPAYADLLTGRIQLIFADLQSSLQHVQAGALRGLAVTSATRAEALPDTPTVAETIPGFEASAWYGFGVPKGTPPAIIERLNREINAGLNDPKVQAKFKELGATAIVMSPQQFSGFMKSETDRWGQAVRAAGVTAD
jgi:tripartite-type tricarboxylate transporter receptor subunit TctC